MPPDARAIANVDDSKRLAPADRVRLAGTIRERALAIGLGAASVREIERINIYHASVLAMRRALGRLRLVPDHVLVDGRPIRTLGVPHQAVVHGDGRCYAIACASIVAKVTRDRLMEALGRRHPAYRWQRNAGYATPDHLAGLTSAGLTPHHRRSFCHVERLAAEMAAAEDRALALEGTGLADLGDDAGEPMVEELATGELLEGAFPDADDLIADAIEREDAFEPDDAPRLPSPRDRPDEGDAAAPA